MQKSKMCLSICRPSAATGVCYANLQVTQTPVMGRVLNPVMRGFAVGFGGIVGFCPMSQCLFRTAQRVGVLHPFLVVSVRNTQTSRGGTQPNIVVVDATKQQEVRVPGFCCETMFPCSVTC